jgi:hypothetical protein
METQSYAGLAHTLQTVAIATLIFAVCAFIPKLDYRLKLAKLPVFGASSSGEKQRQIYIKSAKQMYSDGYKKVGKSQAFAYMDINEAIVQEFCLPDRLAGRRRHCRRTTQSSARIEETPR